MSSEYMRQLIESVKRAQQLNEGPYEDRVSRTADEINRQYPEGIYRKDLESVISRVGSEIGNPELRGSPAARKDFISDVSRLVNKRRDTQANDQKHEAVNRALDKLMEIIDEEIGNSFPDGDPFDGIFPRARKLGIRPDDLIDWLDRAVKKHTRTHTTYHDYLATVWKEHMQTIYGDDAQSQPNYNAFG
jgi:hypothetical protein